LAARPLFEPSDLELETPGVIDFDFQLGLVRGQDSWRLVNPDLELDVGLARNIELDVDGSYSIVGNRQSPFVQPHALPDAVWTSLKLGLFDWIEPGKKRAWAIGSQIGPKFPLATGNRGVGAEGLALWGVTDGNCQLVLNTGIQIDPRPSDVAPRPIGIELGLDARIVLDERQIYALTGELAAVRYVSNYPHQLLSTLGFMISPSDYLDLSITSMVGWLAGSDRYGLLLGASPKLKIFG
jgi:hypothetical protein